MFDTPEEAPKKKRKHAAVAKKAKKTSPPPVPPAIPPIPQDDVRRCGVFSLQLLCAHPVALGWCRSTSSTPTTQAIRRSSLQHCTTSVMQTMTIIASSISVGTTAALVPPPLSLLLTVLRHVARYDGFRNPHGRNYVEMDGVHAIFDLLKVAMKSSPDGFFEILETRACYLPSEGSFDARTAVCVVASRYRYDGTRVLNIKVTTTATEGAAGECVAMLCYAAVILL